MPGALASSLASAPPPQAWLMEIQEHAQDDVVLMLLGNKVGTLALQGSRGWGWGVPGPALTKVPTPGGLCPGTCGEAGGRGEAGQGELGWGGWCASTPGLWGLSRPCQAAHGCLQDYGLPFMETSAKTGLNVDLAFTAIAK